MIQASNRHEELYCLVHRPLRASRSARPRKALQSNVNRERKGRETTKYQTDKPDKPVKPDRPDKSDNIIESRQGQSDKIQHGMISASSTPLGRLSAACAFCFFLLFLSVVSLCCFSLLFLAVVSASFYVKLLGKSLVSFALLPLCLC